MPALLALASACTFGVADFLGGLATRRAHVVAVTLLTNMTGAMLAVVLVLVVDGRWSTDALVWGGLGGPCGLAGLVLLYQGLAVGPNRLVSPLSAVIAAVVPVVIGLASGDRPGAPAIGGLCLAPVAVWLVAGGDVRLANASEQLAGLGLAIIAAALLS